MSDALTNKLKSDFLANIMKHSKKDMQSIIVQEVLSNSANAESVIINALNSGYSVSKSEEQASPEQVTTPPVSNQLNIRDYNEKMALEHLNLSEELLNGLGENVYRVRFVKANGDYRVMWATRNKSIIDGLNKQPKDSGKSESELLEERNKQVTSNKLKVIDLEKGEWRVLNLNNLATVDEEYPNIIKFKADEYSWLRILNEEITLDEMLNNSYIDGQGFVSIGAYGDFLVREEQAEQEVFEESVSNEETENHINANSYSPEYISNYLNRNPELVLDKLSSQICRVMFYKKDGSVREMWCTRNSSIIEAEGQAPKTVKSDSEKAEERQKQLNFGSFTVFDISVRGWRRLSLSNLVTDGDISPIAFFDIDKALWAELFETTKQLENIDTSFNLDTLKFNEESKYVSIPLLDYSRDGLFNSLIGSQNEDERPEINVAMSQYLKQNPEVVSNLLKYNVVRAVFVKRDGSKRVMWCTRNLDLIDNSGFVIKTLEEKAIEIAQFEVYDFEADGIRRLNINQLYVAGNEIPFMAFHILDTNWYKLMKDELNVSDVFNTYKTKSVIDYIEGSDVEFNFDSFLFNSGNMVNMPEELTVTNLIDSFISSENGQDEVVSSSDDRVINKEQLKIIFNKFIENERIIPNMMDIEFDVAFETAQRELSSLPNIEVEFVDFEKKIFIANYRNIFYYGVTPNGVYGMYKRGKSVKVLSNRVNKLQLLPNNASQINSILSNEFSNENIPEENRQELGNIIRRLIKLNMLYSKHFNKKLNVSQVAVNMSKDATIAQKLERVNSGLNLGKTLPARHKLKQTDKQNIKILPNGFIKIQISDYVFYIGDKRAYVYINNKFELIGSFKQQTSFNNEVKMLVDFVVNYANTNLGNRTGNHLQEFLTLYLINGINLRFKGYLPSIESLKGQ